jgi:hypothetical protein
MFLRGSIFCLLFIAITGVLKAQEKVTFLASDKLIVTADLYKPYDTLPYIILCPDQKSSRGEFKDIVKKFNKLGFNCLAVDLRNGGTNNGVVNETAGLAQLKHYTSTLYDVELDIQAAMNYVSQKSKRKMILFGSGYSASLVLDIAANDGRVCAVFAFSPAEDFTSKLNTKQDFPKLGSKPVFIASSVAEAKQVKDYVADIPKDKLTIYVPKVEGAHGSAALANTDPDYHDYWISILMFIRQIP